MFVSKDYSFFVQFGSYNSIVADEISSAYSVEGNAEFFDRVVSSLQSTAKYLNSNSCIFPAEKIPNLMSDVKEWDSVLTKSSTLTLTWTVVFHLSQIWKLYQLNIDVEKLSLSTTAVMGHSIGIISAIAFSKCGTRSEFLNLTEVIIKYVLVLTYRADEYWLKKNGILIEEGTMLSVKHNTENLRDHLIQFNSISKLEEQLELGLINSSEMNVVVGEETALKRFKEFIKPLDPQQDVHSFMLPSSIPYHWSQNVEIISRLSADRSFVGLDSYTKLNCPVIDSMSGDRIPFTTDIYSACATSLLTKAANWPAAVLGAFGISFPDAIIDFGPSGLTKMLTEQIERPACKAAIKYITVSRSVIKSSLAAFEVRHIGENMKSHSNLHQKEFAMVFPGQGSQQKGMGADLLQKYPDLIEISDEILGYSVRELCIDDKGEMLNQTSHAQPAIYIVNALAALDYFSKFSQKPKFFLGHSLGEINALQAAGIFDFVTGLKIVQKRAELMQVAEPGAMAAVIGMDVDKIRMAIDSYGFENLFIANINTADQIVVSGKKCELSEFENIVRMMGARHYIKLNTSGAFHTPMMHTASKMFFDYLQNIKYFGDASKIISNTTAQPYNKDKISTYLAEQIISPVDWNDSVVYAIKHGVADFIEVGDSQVVTRLINVIKNQKKPSVDYV